MRTTTQIAWNAATRWFARIVYGLIGLVLVPFLLGCLGKEGYGLLGVVSAVIGFNVLTDFGVRSALGRHLAEQVATKNTQRFNELASTGLMVFLVIGLVLAGVCFVLAPWLAGVFKVSPELMPQAVFLLRYFAGAASLLAFIRPVYIATLTSSHRFDLANLIQSLVEVTRAVGILVILSLTHSGVHGWAAAYLGADIIGLGVYRWAAIRQWPTLRLRPWLTTKNALHALASLGGYLFGAQLAETVATRGRPIVLTVFCGPAAVALYGPAWALTSVVHPLVDTLGPQLYPLATGYHVSGRKSELQSVLLQGTRYTFLLGIGAYVLLGVFAHSIMHVWLGRSLGSDYVVVAHVLLVLAITQLFVSAVGSQRAVLLGMNRMGFFVWTQLAGAAVSLVGAILLVGYTNLGVVGVVIPAAVESAIRRPIITVYTARACGLSVRRYFLECYLRPLIILAVLGLWAVGVFLWGRPQSLLGLLVCGALVGLAWVPLCWWVGFNAADRKTFGDLLGRLVGLVFRRGAREGTGESNHAGSEVTESPVSSAEPRGSDAG